jgi:hypothetical protein
MARLRAESHSELKAMLLMRQSKKNTVSALLHNEATKCVCKQQALAGVMVRCQQCCDVFHGMHLRASVSVTLPLALG